mgnify:CR=1 FL=1
MAIDPLLVKINQNTSSNAIKTVSRMSASVEMSKSGQ